MEMFVHLDSDIFEKVKTGTKNDLLNLLSKFYSDEEINKYGVVAIEFTLEE